MKNVLVSEFDSRDHLLECLVASCLVPGWAGYKSRIINGKKYIDGGFTVNLPNLYPNETVRIQPFSTSEIHADISPILTNDKDKNRIIAKMAMVKQKMKFQPYDSEFFSLTMKRCVWYFYILSNR